MSIALSRPANKTTIYDVARKVGVSHATVSRALHDSPVVARATRERVKRVARQMNYQPNLVARGLICGSTKTVGLLINGFLLEIAMVKVLTLDKLAGEAGYQLFVANTEASPKQTIRAAHNLMAYGVDGLLLYGLGTADADPDLDAIAGLPVPTVHFDVPMPFACRQVVLDRAAGVVEAVDHLIALGHRELFMLGLDFQGWQRDGRFRGFLQACERHQLSQPASRLVQVGGDRPLPTQGMTGADRTIAAITQFAETHPACTAILCSNDWVATMALAALTQMGRHVPQDVSLVGFDDSTVASCLRPSLSTVAHPVEQVTQAAWQLLGETMRGEQRGPQTVTVKTHFIKRQSIGPVRDRG